MLKNMFPVRRPSWVCAWCVLALSTALFLIRGNPEFLLYAVTLAGLIAILQGSDRRFDYPVSARWLFLVWLLMHMGGGWISIGGVRLYDTILVRLVPAPYHILRYDQLVHALCYFVLALIVLRIMDHVAGEGNASRGWRCLMGALAAMGIGALNEVIEFGAVAGFGSEGVGDYYNNALDHVFNLVGVIAALIVYRPRGPALRGP